MCKPLTTYKIVNPSSYIIIDGQCVDQCLSNTLLYNYKLFYSNEESNLGKSRIGWTSLTNINGSLVKGKDKPKNRFFHDIRKKSCNILKPNLAPMSKITYITYKMTFLR